MPTLGAAYRGVQFSTAYKQAAAIAPMSYAILFAYELWHPTLGTPFYFVNDRVDLVATIEATASRGAGTTQTFTACLLSMQRPEESDVAESPQITLSRADVAGALSVALRAARGSLVPWELIERRYASNDTSGPAILPPLTMYLSGATVVSAGASISASYGDPANVSVPAKTFRRAQYPTLDF